MKKELETLRAAMIQAGIDAYLIPTTDFHGSEYVNPYFKCRQYLSGFTGSAGTLLVTGEWAGLWTDGRYFIQAAAQLEGSGITLMKEGEPGVPAVSEYLSENLPEGSTLGFDGRVVSCREAEGFAAKYRLRTDVDLAGEVWAGRPVLMPSRIYPLGLDVTGESPESKLRRIRNAVKEAGADYHLITSLEDIAWIYNLRGNDIKNNAVFYSFALIEEKGDRLYVLDESFAGSEAAGKLPETTEILPYFQAYDDMEKLPAGKILLDRDSVSQALCRKLPDGVKIIEGRNPSEKMKAVKNQVEIGCTERAHIKDGAAMTEFICWLKKQMAEGAELTEMEAAEYAERCRSRREGFLQPSFDTIAGYGPDGAIIHYSATEETNQKLKPEGFLLVDSGGQYTDGTTDITRTIALGPLTEEMKLHYTLVLKGHISLAMARFTEGTTGAELDKLARGPLLKQGLNYKHGTGHGVGHLLSVHEGPQSISPRGTGCPVLPGMITSNEPGLYLEGKYGIRLENEVLCEKGEDGLLQFRTVTLCPWEREAIITELLSTDELKWVDNYHNHVYQALKPYLNLECAKWLQNACGPLI